MSNYPYRHENAIVLRVFVAVDLTEKLQKILSANQIFHHQSKGATDSTS